MQPRRHSLPLANTVGTEGKHQIVFYDWGNINAQHTAICVHGLTRNARDFDRLAAHLASKGRRVLCLNMAGRGESAWLADPMGYNYASYVADCIAIMDNFHLRNVEWVGTSMGGIIGMMVAANYPGRIRRLVMNDIGTHLSKESLARIYTYVNSLPASFPTRAAAETYLAEAFKPFKITDAAQWAEFVAASLITHADGRITYACDPAIVVPLREATQNFTDMQDVNLTPIWDAVEAPTLIVRGAESDILSEDTVRLMQKVHPRAESITIAGVGHAPPLMNDSEIRRVSDWLTGSSVAGMLAAGL